MSRRSAPSSRAAGFISRSMAASSRARPSATHCKGCGFEELAETNRIVVLFPQIKASVINQNGCWDWWGYTGLDYLGKDAPQIEAIWAMVERRQTP